MRDDKVDRLAKKLVDDGKLVEAGFAVIDGVLGAGLTPEKRADLRYAYFAGAQHVFSSIMGFLDGTQEPTEKDLARLTSLAEELKRIEPELKARFLPS